jgi:hypothetical protein
MTPSAQSSQARPTAVVLEGAGVDQMKRGAGEAAKPFSCRPARPGGRFGESAMRYIRTGVHEQLNNGLLAYG